MGAEHSGLKTRQELAQQLHISPKTFDQKVKPLNILIKKPGKRKRLYYPGEIKMIMEYFGVTV